MKNIPKIAIVLTIFTLLISEKAFSEKRYVDQKNKKNLITFGFEIEIDWNNIQQSNKFIEYYHPEWVDDQEWRKLTRDEKIKKIKNEKNTNDVLFCDFKLTCPKGDETFCTYLPDYAVNDMHQNIELNGKKMVFEDLEDARTFVVEFRKRFGEGFIQGHVVLDRKTGINTVDLNATAGLILKQSDKAFFKRLETRYNYIGKTNRPLSNIFTSAYLGPATTDTIDQAEKIVKLHNNDLVGTSERGNRFSGPLLRTDGYNDLKNSALKIGFELRQYDQRTKTTDGEPIFKNNFDNLLDSMDELSGALSKNGNLNLYQKYKKVGLPKISSEKDVCSKELANLQYYFISNPEDIDSQKLTEICTTASEGVYPGKFNASKFWQTYLFPLRDWSHYPLVCEIKDKKIRKTLQNKIMKESEEYFKLLVKTLSNVESWSSTLEKLAIGAAKWAHELHLSPLFDEKAKISHLQSTISCFEPVQISNQFIQLDSEISSIAKKVKFENRHPFSDAKCEDE